jgi:nitrite reductase/ring-hydroxylating ferredoxin subunit
MLRRFACQTDRLQPGESMSVAGDPPIALFRNDEGDFFATADWCTHEQWSLGEDSDLDGNEVTCPLHLASFDIRTGRALCLPATESLATYDIEIDGEAIYVIEPARDAAIS